MKKNVVEILFAGNNFSAHIPDLPGCVSVGDTPDEIKAHIQEALEIHLAGMREDGDKMPASFSGKYELIYKFDAESLLSYYKGLFNKKGLEKLPGISQAQLQHYSKGIKKPRPEQIKKIKSAMHQLGSELLALEL